jgi:putative ABC transport system permease protein
MRIPFLSGRDFTDADTDENAPLRFVVNETMARTMFPGENALGRHLIVGMQRVNKPGEIVGVVADIKHYGLQSPAKAMVYYPQGQLTFGFGTLVVRTAGDPHAMSRAVVVLVRQMDPDQAVADVRTMEEWMSRSLSTQRFTMSLLLGFAALAVFLAVFGISSMLRFAVSQRTHEIGIRVALGARSGQIRWAVARQGLVLTLLGAAIGLGAALASARVLKSLVFGIEAHDPVTIAGATTVLILAAGLASDWPARKAAQVDPVNALRSE